MCEQSIKMRDVSICALRQLSDALRPQPLSRIQRQSAVPVGARYAQHVGSPWQVRPLRFGGCQRVKKVENDGLGPGVLLGGLTQQANRRAPVGESPPVCVRLSE